MKVKQFFLMLLVALTISFGFTSCATVDSGNEGVGVSWGGETDMYKTYTEGLHWGVRWIFDDMIDYDCRQKTVTLDNEFLDKDGLPIPIKAVLYYKPVNNTVNKLHKDLGPKFEEDKIKPIFSAALKNVVPKYKALELNVEYRDEADAELAKYLEKELQANYCIFIRVNIIDVDIPGDIKNVIIAKQKQDEANLLAEKKERENFNLGRALLVKDSLEWKAAEYATKTKDLLSQPKMLELKRLEIDDKKWEGFLKHGNSPYGNNNMFGVETSIVKGLK